MHTDPERVRRNLRSAIHKLHRLIDTADDPAVQTGLEVVLVNIREALALLEDDQRRNGGLYGFLPNGKAYLDEDELDGLDALDENSVFDDE